MAMVSSLSAALLPPLSLSTSSSSLSSNPKFSALCFQSGNTFKLRTSKLLHSSTRVYAAPEVLDSEEPLDVPTETLGDDESEATTFQVGDSDTRTTSSISIGGDPDTMAPKQKIRIKLRSYWVPLIEDSCKQILDAARNTNAKTMGPVPLPTKKRIYCVLKSPHVHKDARFHFEIRTHQRLIDILYPTAQTIDSLMQLDLPAGVDVEVKL
ncbi:30S ribosomal protein S10, chloroplastic [Arachis stenosperma]|uniref:30S ribosomal protein S10, chloroplastic n=1 Tax=Arachis stenosperma TaxID=217475 RepID=UPI0025AC3C43|nr:30S ribosomal protein S10, chloroplastic [Arachis stenosperma]